MKISSSLKNEKYYWIKVNKVNSVLPSYIPIYRNFHGKWCYDTLHTRIFISDYKLQLLHGRDCICREVDFENDIEDFKESDIIDFVYFCSDKQVWFGNKLFIWYQGIQKNKFDHCKKLVFKE